MSECDQMHEASAYYDGELSPEERQHFEAHVAQCASCASELQALEQLSGLLRDAVPSTVPPETLAHLRRAARVAQVVPLARRLTALAASILVACSIWLWSTAGRGPTTGAVRWEVVAMTLPESADVDEAQLTARWIVADLSLENGHD